MNTLLEVRNLSVSYRGQQEAVKNVSFQMEAGEILSIVGESGSGKSTLLRSIPGLLPGGGKILQGEILFEGRDMTKLRKSEQKKLRGTDISMIFQDAGLAMDPIQTIGAQYLEYLRLHRKMPRREAREMAVSWLRRLSLSDADRVMGSYPFELSGGMKQRVAIAMAMSYNPKLLLADEPTSALDVTIQAQVVAELKRLQREFHTAIILVTHNMGVASYLSEYIGVMKDGELVEFGTRDQVIEQPQSDYTKMLLQAVPELQ